MLLGLKTMDGGEFWLGARARTVPCFRCGLCCTDYLVKLSGQDIALLCRGLGIPKAVLFRKHVRKTPVGPVLRQNGRECVFLSREENGVTGCSVYAFRPEVCRNYLPSLLRPDCQQGLRRLGKSGKVVLPGEMYQSVDDAAGLLDCIEDKLPGPEVQRGGENENDLRDSHAV
jgi:hypothetical protein